MILKILKPLAVVALLLVPAGASPASPPPDGRHGRATVALVAELPDPGARALLILRAHSRDGVILLRRDDATPADLAAAIALLNRTRHNEPVPLGRDRQVILRTASIARPLSDHARRRLTEQITRLKHAPPRDIEGVGNVPAIEVRLAGNGRPHG
jgi:hypothetical protein